MSKELFMKVRDLSKKKRKNEEAVPMEVLTTKYKTPYDNLCNELKENQKQLRLNYMESVRIASEFISKTVYMDLSSDDEWKKLLQKRDDLCREGNLLTKMLLDAFVLTINRYVRGD